MSIHYIHNPTLLVECVSFHNSFIFCITCMGLASRRKKNLYETHFRFTFLVKNVQSAPRKHGLGTNLLLTHRGNIWMKLGNSICRPPFALLKSQQVLECLIIFFKLFNWQMIITLIKRLPSLLSWVNIMKIVSNK